MAKSTERDFTFTQNRELSWLRFNERVLQEAEDEKVPLFERLKFISIFTSNLDEFFMIRVGSLSDLVLLDQNERDNKSGMTPSEQLHAIYEAVVPLYKYRDRLLNEVESQLRQFGVCHLTVKELSPADRKFASEYYHTEVKPLLSPQIIDSCHPFPHLVNKELNIAVLFRSKENAEKLGLIPIPSALPRMIFFPGAGMRYLLLEQLILDNAEDVFHMYPVSEKAVITVTRNADVNPDEETFDTEEDYRRHMKKVLKKRARLACVRLELQPDGNSNLRELLQKRLNLVKEQTFKCRCPLTMPYVFSLLDKMSPSLRRPLTYPAFEPAEPDFSTDDGMLRLCQRRDVLLFYPYESMEPFLQLVREAAYDPAVVSIKITIYRLASKSRLVEYLSAAAENGKDVLALMELRARFDEANNINWAENLEDAGCRVIYGCEDFKVHSKICLITRRDRGKVSYITQIGTGNYNEKTAKLYTDFCLITADREIGEDASVFFQNMAVADLQGEYHSLMVAPNSLKDRLIGMIDHQISLVKEGKESKIIIKTNSVTDRDLIDKLSEASQAGVQIDLIVRGICCILPKIPGKTDHLRVTSVVGRFLEHSRVYCFIGGGECELFISSADIMTRNTTRRVEIACPVKDLKCKKRIISILETMLSDNVKARMIRPDGTYERLQADQAVAIDCQEQFLEEAQNRQPEMRSGSFLRFFRRKAKQEE